MIAFLEYLARIGLIQFAAAQMAWFTLGYAAYWGLIANGLIRAGAFTRMLDAMAAGDAEQSRHDRDDDCLYPGEMLIFLVILASAISLIVWILAVR